MNTESKKAHARDAYREFVENYFELDFGKLSDNHRSEGLLRFYLTQIYNKIHTPITEEDIESGFVDGSNDLGIDFIHRDDQTVLILQGKQLKPHKSVDVKDIQHFQSILTRIRDEKFTPNRRLREIIAEIDFKNDKFVLKFIVMGDISGQAEDQTFGKIQFAPDLAERVDFEYLAECDLNTELRNALTLGAGLPGTCTLVATGKPGQRTPIIHLSDSSYQSCVLVVKADQIINLYQQHRDKLFTLNIRNYLGSTATNKLILETLKNESENFYYYNNGISCIAEKITIKDDRVDVDGIQVINGAQTVRSLVKAAKASSEARNSLILVRVTETLKNYGADGRFRNQIVRFNNTQNVIKVSDFLSNDAVHESLRSQFAQYKRNGRVVNYVAKRTDLREMRNSEVIQMQEFARVIYAFLKEPVSFSRATSFLFDTENGGYKDIFGDGSEIWTMMPESEFRLRSAIWWMSVAFTEKSKIDKQETQDNIVKSALERKWMLLFVARLILERTYNGESYKSDLSRTYKGDWTTGDGKVGQWFYELYNTCKDVVVYQYNEAFDKPGFVHRNWMRSEHTVKALTTYVNRAPIRFDKLLR